MRTQFKLADPNDEFPHPLPLGKAPKYYSENYLFCGYDGNIGFFTHMGRTPMDPMLWRGLMILYLPEGKLLVAKDYGRGETPRGPRSNSLQFECRRPLEEWTIHYDGIARPVERHQLLSGVLSDGLVEPVSFDLKFEALAPVWNFWEDMVPKGDPVGHLHHEGPGRISGTITRAGQVTNFQGTGYRDHTVGVREMSGVLYTSWCHAQFPSGRSFSAIKHRTRNRPTVRAGFISAGEDLTPVELLDIPDLSSPSGAPERFTVRLGNDQKIEEIQGEIQHSAPITWVAPYEILHGTDWSRPYALVSVEAPARYWWDGEEGFGHCERACISQQLSLAGVPMEVPGWQENGCDQSAGFLTRSGETPALVKGCN